MRYTAAILTTVAILIMAGIRTEIMVLMITAMRTATQIRLTAIPVAHHMTRLPTMAVILASRPTRVRRLHRRPFRDIIGIIAPDRRGIIPT